MRRKKNKLNEFFVVQLKHFKRSDFVFGGQLMVDERKGLLCAEFDLLL